MDISTIRISRDVKINLKELIPLIVGQHLIITWDVVWKDTKTGDFGTLYISSPMMINPIIESKNSPKKAMDEVCETLNFRIKRSDRGYVASGTVNPHLLEEAML